MIWGILWRVSKIEYVGAGALDSPVHDRTGQIYCQYRDVVGAVLYKSKFIRLTKNSKGGNEMGKIVVLFLFLVLLIIIWYISVSNSIKVAALKVDESESGIDVALTKRYDVLTKMLDTVKGYQKYEQSVLSELVELRTGMSMAEKKAANDTMDKVSRDISVLAEGYPELKANTNFIELQRAIVDVEEHLQAARRLYNSNVNAYNAKLVVFPSSIVAKNMGAVKRELFEADEIKKQDVKMQF